jgi:hypothetical protein
VGYAPRKRAESRGVRGGSLRWSEACAARRWRGPGACAARACGVRRRARRARGGNLAEFVGVRGARRRRRPAGSVDVIQGRPCPHNGRHPCRPGLSSCGPPGRRNCAQAPASCRLCRACSPPSLRRRPAGCACLAEGVPLPPDSGHSGQSRKDALVTVPVVPVVRRLCGTLSRAVAGRPPAGRLACRGKKAIQRDGERPGSENRSDLFSHSYENRSDLFSALPPVSGQSGKLAFVTVPFVRRFAARSAGPSRAVPPRDGWACRGRRRQANETAWAQRSPHVKRAGRTPASGWWTTPPTSRQDAGPCAGHGRPRPSLWQPAGCRRRRSPYGLPCISRLDAGVAAHASELRNLPPRHASDLRTLPPRTSLAAPNR